jgi:serine/threonine protein kinase
MGNCNSRSDAFDPSVAQNRNNYIFEYPIGKGGFGKVWKVVSKRTKTTFAMKEMLKGRVITKRSVHSVMNERKLLAKLRNSFIVNMHFAFQDRDNLYLVMDLMPGGDLRYHISRRKRFSEEQARFFIACILCGLEYLHKDNIIHRDLKPENLVLDTRGYVHITDFGIAREWRADNAQETSGTPGYMAPEVMCRQNHTIAADYFAVGVITYEFMMGRRPYVGRNRKEIRDAILAKQAGIKSSDVPEGWSQEAADFANRLLQRKPASRLGYNGPAEVLSHPWVSAFPWPLLKAKSLSPPYIPDPGDNFDARVAGQDWKDDAEAIAAALKQSASQALFEGYFYDPTAQPASEGNIVTGK